MQKTVAHAEAEDAPDGVQKIQFLELQDDSEDYFRRLPNLSSLEDPENKKFGHGRPRSVIHRKRLQNNEIKLE